MRSRFFITLLVCVSLVVIATQLVTGASPKPGTQLGSVSPDGWEMVGIGIDYKEFHLDDPNRVYVARLDRQNTAATLDSSIASGSLASGTELVSNMARRYDDSLSFWGGSWGARNKVVVAINGSYFSGDGWPQSGQFISGWYTKRFSDMGGGSGFAWKMDRTAFMGGCIYHRPEKQVVTFLATGNTQRLDGLNVPRRLNELILYTPQLAANTGTDNNGAEVLVELTKPAMLIPPPAYVAGHVVAISDGRGSTVIPFDSVVLSANGLARETLLENVHIGDEIGISQEITTYEADCQTPQSTSWAKTYASVGGAYLFLKDGEVQKFDDKGALDRHPRTAIVYNDDYVYFVVVDGRYPDASIGMTIRELARFTRDTLGVSWGMALDGGGSSTLVVNGKVMNQPSDACYTVYVPQVNKGGALEKFPQEAGTPMGTPAPSRLPGCERPVANGMLMVNLAPMERSHTYKPKDSVIARQLFPLRLGPGNNFLVLTNIPAGKAGVIQNHSTSLDGVLASGSYWWLVSFGKFTGWAPEEILLRYNPVGIDNLIQ